MSIDQIVTDILALIGDTDRNRFYLWALIQQLTSLLRVTPFVGAGLSAPFGYPTWGQFLIQQAQEQHIEEEVRLLLQNGDYEGAAELLQERQPHGAFEDSLQDAFGDHKLLGNRLSGAVMILPRLVNGPVITTNFDHVLEKAFEQSGSKLEPVLWGGKTRAITNVLNLSKRGLLKIHGDVDDPADRVLSRSDYERAYGSDGTISLNFDRPLSQALYRIMIQRPLLFIGCGLAQDRTMAMLRQVIQILPDTQHYAIVSSPASTPERKDRAQSLAQLGIRPIWYPHGEHRLLEPLLHALTNAVESSSSPLVRFQELATQLENIDTHYEVQSLEVGVSGAKITVQERFEGASIEKPLKMKGTIAFPDTEEGKHYREQLEQHIDTGAPVTIPKEFVKVTEYPDIIERVASLLDTYLPRQVSLDISAITDNREVLAKLDFRCDDGDTCSIPYLHLRVTQRGKKQITLENIGQPTPIRVRMVFNEVERSATIHFRFDGPPVHVAQALEWFKLRRCISKPVRITLTNLQTQITAPEQRWPKGINQPPDEGLIEQLQDLVAIQQRTGIPVVIPEESWSKQDQRAIGRLRTILHEGRIATTWKKFSANILPEGVRIILDTVQQEGRKFLVVVQDDTEELFGSPIPLGKVRIEYRDIQLVDEDDVRRKLAGSADETDPIKVQFKPGTDNALVWEYLDWLPGLEPSSMEDGDPDQEPTESK